MTFAHCHSSLSLMASASPVACLHLQLSRSLLQLPSQAVWCTSGCRSMGGSSCVTWQPAQHPGEPDPKTKRLKGRRCRRALT